MGTCLTIAILVVGCLAGVGFHIYLFSPISPHICDWPPPSSPSNSLLQGVMKVGEGSILGPEDVGVDTQNGIVYATSRDGWIKRLHRDGSLENWKKLNSSSMLGIIVTKDGDVVVCDAEQGLVKVNEDGVTILTSHYNGSKINFADELVEAADGTIYFTNPSVKYGFPNYWFLDILETSPNGQLLKYDPSTKETSLVLDSLSFPNGVALSVSQDYLLFCETWKFRCMKHWLKGDLKGTTEIFVDNLPGYPDNIHISPDGSFWIALLELPGIMRFVHSSKLAKHVLATYQTMGRYITLPLQKAMVVNVDTHGNIQRRLDDPDGTAMTFVTTVLEYEDHLYFGSLANNFIGKLPLREVSH